MQQQINLYLLLPINAGRYFTKKLVIVTYGIFFLCLLLAYFFSLWREQELAVQYYQMNQEVRTLQERANALMQDYPISSSTDLKTAMQQARTDYENKLNAVDQLVPAANYTAYLIALASSTVTGVWLREIEFNRTGTKIALRGFSLQHPLLDQFLTQLERQPAFAGLIFRLEELSEANIPASFYITGKSE